MRDLKGKTAVVTGGASGIGRGLAERFAHEGMSVVLADIEEGPLTEAAKALEGDGASVLAVPTDVSRADDVQTLADKAVAAFGAVHVICNNAGVGAGGPMWEIPQEDWDWVLGVNLFGVINGIRAFVPLLLAQGEGHVVNTASMAGLTSPPGMSPYNVSKHGVVTLSEGLRSELQMQGSAVGVSVLCPGFVRTRIHESGRNRPGSEPMEEGDLDPSFGPMADFLRQAVEAGIPPNQVAEKVVDAVLSNRFYILTHPDMKPAIQSRMEEILGS
jgi:NAD(P)-dependent dehydrogenase (short-subunit alcohol dehydrogenase family)